MMFHRLFTLRAVNGVLQAHLFPQGPPAPVLPAIAPVQGAVIEMWSTQVPCAGGGGCQ